MCFPCRYNLVERAFSALSLQTCCVKSSRCCGWIFSLNYLLMRDQHYRKWGQRIFPTKKNTKQNSRVTASLTKQENRQGNEEQSGEWGTENRTGNKAQNASGRNKQQQGTDKHLREKQEITKSDGGEQLGREKQRPKSSALVQLCDCNKAARGSSPGSPMAASSGVSGVSLTLTHFDTPKAREQEEENLVP